MLTRLDSQGRANVTDATEKVMTSREATTGTVMRIRPEALQLTQGGGHPKGDIFVVARITSIQAAKRTHGLIPLYHPLLPISAKFELQAEVPDAMRIRVRCWLAGRTGVKMEALTAVSIAALTIYDICEMMDHGMIIKQVQLPERFGGKNDHYRKEEEGQA